MKLQSIETTEQWIAKGLVFGRNWGFSYNTYPSIVFYADTYKDLEIQINRAIDNGSIDSGFGFESINGALMNIECLTEIEIEGYTFKNSEYSQEYFGDLSEEQQIFLEEALND